MTMCLHMNQQAHGGAKCMWSGLKLKIGDFRQITGYISKTVQDRRIVSIKVKQEVVCALSNGDIADNLEWPIILTAPNYLSFYILHRFSYLHNGYS